MIKEFQVNAKNYRIILEDIPRPPLLSFFVLEKICFSVVLFLRFAELFINATSFKENFALISSAPAILMIKFGPNNPMEYLLSLQNIALHSKLNCRKTL